MPSRTALVATLLTAATLTAATPQELVRQSLQNYKRNYLEAVQRFTYMERDVEHNGATTKESISKVFAVNDLPYERTISRNGKPLTAEQNSKEEAKFRKRRDESASAQAKRKADYGKSLKFLNEVPDAYTFKIIGEETIKGRPNYVIACTPRPGYQPGDSRAAMFAHIQATLWIDKEDIQWTRAKAKVTDTISIGWILARIGPGAEIQMNQTRLSDKYWLPDLLDINGDAKVLLFVDHPIHEQVTYYDFKPAEPRATGNVSQLATK